MEPLLPEDLYPIETPPVKAQSNNEGRVLFYSTKHGWYDSMYNNPFFEDTSHWTLLPDKPNVVITSSIKCNKVFDAWCDEQKTSAISREFLFPAFRKGWESRIKNAYN